MKPQLLCTLRQVKPTKQNRSRSLWRSVCADCIDNMTVNVATGVQGREAPCVLCGTLTIERVTLIGGE